MAQLVMLWQVTDSFTYWHAAIKPIRAESVEAAIVEFEDAYNAAKKAQAATKWPEASVVSFEVFGHTLPIDGFEQDRVYECPTFLTIDEWFLSEGV